MKFPGKLCFILVLMCISLPMFGGEIFVVHQRLYADVVVYVTNNPNEADLYVRVTTVELYAKKNDHYWKFVKHQLPSVVKVYFTKYKRDADVIVFYSTWIFGWQKANKFQGRLQ